MEPIGRPRMGSNTNATVATVASAISAVVGLPLSPGRLSVSTVTSNTKTTGLCHNRVPLQHCGTGSNIIHHLQYPAIQPPSVRPSLIHSTHSNSLQSTSPQLMLSTTTATTPEVLPQYQQHNVVSHQLVTVPVSANPIVMPTSNITSAGMALSPFGILPHERVVPHQTYHRHQHRKLQTNVQASKTLIDTNNSSGPQILSTPTINSQRFYAEPTHLSNKMKQYESVQQQQQQQNNGNKIPNGILDKSLPVVSSAYVPQSYEQRYQPRTASQQVGYMSVITRTAGTTSNGIVMDDITANNNYYQAQAIPLQSKTSDIHSRPYYHFDNTVSASQIPQQQLDNMLLMGSPVQRGDPMHIVKNLQSMQTEIDCYGIKKIIEHQPRSLATDNSKTVGTTTLLGNGSKCIIEQQHQHLQLPKSAVINSSLSYNGQYFNKLQPPPAHLQHHTVTGNTKMLPTPTSLTVVSTNGNTYMDVQQHQINHRWNSDQQKPPIVSTSSCFSGNISTGVYHQPTTPIQHQNYNNAVSTFNVQPSGSNLHQHQQMLQPAHHNNFSSVSSINPTYYNPTTMVSPSSTASSVNTISPPTPPPPLLLYNRQQQSTTNDFNSVQSGNFVVNDNNSSLPNVIVPDIEEELSYLCDDSTSTSNITVKPLNISSQKPTFIDSYIKFIRGDTGRTATKMDNECNDRPKKLLQPLMTTPKHISKPYIPMSKSKVISISEQTSSRNGACKNVKKKNSNVMKTTDDDPRYFPLPKTSSITDNSDGESNGENSWLSADDDNFNWSTSSKTVSNIAKPAIKNKADLLNKKKTNNGTTKRKTNSATAIKKQKTQHEQPRRKLSHRLAKEKTQKLLSSINGELDLDDDILSEVDSDVDPAWIPNNEDNDTSKNVSSLSGRCLGHKKISNSGHMPSTSSSINNNNLPDDSTMPFKSGTFVVLKSEFEDNGQKIPKHLWRVDGKSMLQKFEQLDGDNIYKSVSTYTGWSPSYYELYCQVTVDLVTSHKSKCVSTKLPAEFLVQIVYDDNNKSAQNNSVVNTEVGLTNVNDINKTKVSAINSIDDQIILLRSNFDVYIQTLASQALDSNFLGEIYRENDDYFLSNMHAIETVTQSWVHAIDSTIMEDSKADLSIVHTVISRYPIVKVCSTDEMSAQLHCIICSCQGFIGKQQKFVKVSLSGSEYNAQTLKTIDSNRVFSKIIPVKTVYCCTNAQCTDKLSILHSLKHLKYNIYETCCKRITAENNNCRNELTQDKTTVLNRLLADDKWIDKLYKVVCDTWSRAESFISNRQSNSRVSSL